MRPNEPSWSHGAEAQIQDAHELPVKEQGKNREWPKQDPNKDFS
jgi:hypothetical protein